jgi:signal transduction histidine kinase
VAQGPVVGAFDAVRVNQLLSNLLENAAKYSPPGSPIVVEVWQDQGQARLQVRDAGIGLATADLPAVFDRFYRGTNVDDRRFAGLGLGLNICRAIAEQHGGRIWASSAGPGQGSTFGVALPLAAPVPIPRES